MVCQRHTDWKQGLRGESLYSRYNSMGGESNDLHVCFKLRYNAKISKDNKWSCYGHSSCAFIYIVVTSFVVSMNLVTSRNIKKHDRKHSSVLASQCRYLCSKLFKMVMELVVIFNCIYDIEEHKFHMQSFLLTCLPIIGAGTVTVQVNVGFFRALNPSKVLDEKAAKKKAPLLENDGTPDISSTGLLNSYTDKSTPRSLKPNSPKPKNNR